MSSQRSAELHSWLDRRVRDRRGEPFGVVVDVYTGLHSRRPTWLEIRVAMPPALVVAPVHGASLNGADVVLSHLQETVISAPRVNLTSLDEHDERVVSRHYAISELEVSLG